jgi:WD40 repeat protein
LFFQELLKVIYVDKEMNFLKDIGLTGTERMDNSAAYDGKNGVRALRVSPDGKHLASGDRTGNIRYCRYYLFYDIICFECVLHKLYKMYVCRVHDVATLEELCLIEAHDAEVLCLEYSQANLRNHKLLASASRDRLVHVFDVNKVKLLTSFLVFI